MAAAIKPQVDLKGLQQVLTALTGSASLARKLAKKRLYKVARDAREDMRQNAPRKRGVLRRNIKARTTRSGGAQVYVDKGVAPHWYVSGEGGTKDRTTKSGAFRGRVQERPWIKPARERAFARYRNEVSIPLLRELRRMLQEQIRNAR